MTFSNLNGQEKDTLKTKQDTVNPVSSWLPKKLPTSRKVLADYNLRRTLWSVFVERDTVFAEVYQYSDLKGAVPPFEINTDSISILSAFNGGRKTTLKVDDGWLIGFNLGEWGGGLWWFNNKGSEHYEICYGNIQNFFVRDDKILVIEGLAHLSMSSGTIFEVYKKDGKWESKDFVNLPGAPYSSIQNSNGDLIIVTAESLIKVETNGKIESLIEEGFWHYYLHPTSSIILRDTLYIGMTGGVFKVDLNNPSKQQWLEPGN